MSAAIVSFPLAHKVTKLLSSHVSIEFIDFSLFDHKIKLYFSLEHLATGAAMINVSQYYWSSKQ
jgi:hypothetical protein